MAERVCAYPDKDYRSRQNKQWINHAKLILIGELILILQECCFGLGLGHFTHALPIFIYILHVTGGWGMALSAQNYMLGGIPCHNPHTWSSIPCIASWRGQAMASCSHYNEWQPQTWCPPCWCWGCIPGQAHANSFRWVSWSCRMWWDQEVKFRASIAFCSHSAHIEAKKKFKLKYDFFLWYNQTIWKKWQVPKSNISTTHKTKTLLYRVPKDSFKKWCMKKISSRHELRNFWRRNLCDYSFSSPY